KGLADPRPVDADLTAAQIDGMVRKAIELGDTRTGGLDKIIGPEEWVVVKLNLSAYDGQEGYVTGSATDPRVVESLLAWLAEHHCGQRITLAEGSALWQTVERSHAKADGWTTDWGGKFGGFSYRQMIDRISKRYPQTRFEIVDLNFDDPLEMPVPGKSIAKNNPDGMYLIPKTIQQCDRLISVGPLQTRPGVGVSLALDNYLGIAPGSKYGFPKDGLSKLGSREEVMIDLFNFRPADYALLGGSYGVEGEGPAGPNAASVHHNLVLAGTNAMATDAVAAAIMGFRPAELPYLQLAWKNGLGIYDTDSIWMRGNEIEQAARPFRKPGNWKKA
ncbi:MAG TPA: DUF362 domain-containing protein, partial [Bryobacteraceae bacterium]|nr:DUF362 domain-containing protein [Bryobacteraceae bacterium]